jgi:UDP:flavonoid glycosyltransferase YjiC (YdhE family)
VALLGVGPQPIPRPKLTVKRLAAAIETAVTDSAMQQRAVELGRKIQAENGVETAVQLINQYLES